MQTATNPHHLASHGAFRHQHQQQQPQQMRYKQQYQQQQMQYQQQYQQQQQPPPQQQMHSYQPHHYNTPNRYSTNANNQTYCKGKKPSLAAFDPFSSSEGAVSPMGRDSSPTSADHSDQQRQPVTPVQNARPNATSHNTPTNYNYQTPVSTRETFDNEKSSSKNPVKKFLRKAEKLKNRSLGQHSPSNSGHKRTSKDNNKSSISNNKGKTSPVAAKKTVTAETVSAAKESNKGTKTSAAIAEGASPKKDREKSNTTTTMAQDLMELKEEFGNLQIPSLMAKSAPTSFLMGTGDEAVTTNCSNEPTPFQLEIPSLSEVVTMARLNEFVENYRRHDQNLDLRQFIGLDRMELQHKIVSSINTNNKSGSSSDTMVPEHVPIVQSLLDCSEGQEQEISVQGFLTEPGNLHADSRVEAVIFQGQRNFTVIFRGTTEQQSKVLGNSKSKKRAVPLDSKNVAAEVYSGFLESYSKVEAECFRTIDKLVDENPFCDFVFSGYSFGAALATLAAVRYAKARPMMRVGCLTLASPKVGFSHFRHVVNTTPNLKVVRLELGGQTETKCQGPTVGGWHVGHTLVLNASNSNGSSSPSRSVSPTNGASSSPERKQPSVSVYKFEAPKHKNGGFFKTANPGLKKYISALEDLATLENNRNQAAAASSNGGKKLKQEASPWPKDFANNAGQGVIVNNESRLVV